MQRGERDRIIIVETENELRLIEADRTAKINWSIAGDNVWLVTDVQTTPQQAETLMAQFLSVIKKHQKKVILLCEAAHVYFPKEPEALALQKEMDPTRYKKFLESERNR